jgi:SAM-dependent methyltransferase
MTSEQELWQLDGDTPELYERYLVPAITSLWAADLINRAAPQPTDRVLDIACGTGAVTRLAADRVTTGRVVGLDLNPGMLKVEDVTVSIVTMTIGLPSVEDYVRFQLLATPMAGLLSTLDPQARDQAIEATALRTKAFLDPEHTRDDQFTFPQEAYVVCARCASRRVQ